MSRERGVTHRRVVRDGIRKVGGTESLMSMTWVGYGSEW